MLFNATSIKDSPSIIDKIPVVGSLLTAEDIDSIRSISNCCTTQRERSWLRQEDNRGTSEEGTTGRSLKRFLRRLVAHNVKIKYIVVQSDGDKKRIKRVASEAEGGFKAIRIPAMYIWTELAVTWKF